MRRLCAAIMLLVASAPASFVQSQVGDKNAADAQQISVEQQLKQVEREWNDAVVRRDAAALERILSDDFMLITAAGTVSTKAQLIDTIKSPDLVIEPFDTQDVSVRVYGDTAVVTGRFTQKGSYKGKAFSNQFRYTDVYVKRALGWQAVSAQSTFIPKP